MSLTTQTCRRTVKQVHELMDDESSWDEPLTPALSAFVAELEATYPGLDEDPDNSPWSSWPLDSNAMVAGRCVGLNIGWSHAETMHVAIARACRHHGLTLFDPQDDTFDRPNSDRPSSHARSWRKRR